MTLTEIINYRRSVRNYKDISIDTEKVKHCIAPATLAPNSSNMQLDNLSRWRPEPGSEIERATAIINPRRIANGDFINVRPNPVYIYFTALI